MEERIVDMKSSITSRKVSGVRHHEPNWYELRASFCFLLVVELVAWLRAIFLLQAQRLSPRDLELGIKHRVSKGAPRNKFATALTDPEFYALKIFVRGGGNDGRAISMSPMLFLAESRFLVSTNKIVSMPELAFSALRL